MEIEQILLKDILGALGLPDSTTNRQQLDVLLQALELFNSRNRLRGDLWVEFGLENTGHNIQLKGQRLKALATKPEYQEEALDDALDVINYSAFAVRHVLKMYPDEEIPGPEPTPAQAELWAKEDPPEVRGEGMQPYLRDPNRARSMMEPVPGGPTTEQLRARRPCRCAHPFNWHDTRIPAMSQRQVEEAGIRGRCSAISCPCANFQEGP